MIREARAQFPELRRYGKRALLAMAREFVSARESDERDRLAHAEAVAAGGFADVRAVVLAEFRAWFTGRGDVLVTHSKPVAHDPRKHDWRTHS
jgi:hypothetical protein